MTLPLEKKKLPNELYESIPPLLECLEDRSADVRKSAHAVVPLVMAHTGFEPLSREANKLVVSIFRIFHSVVVWFTRVIAAFV